MRTLGEIIEAAKSGESPSVDELRLAVCAMDYLLTFDRMAIQKLAEGEAGQRPRFLVFSAVWQRNENFNRIKSAMEKTPREYLGNNYDPDNPEVQERRAATMKLVDGLMRNAGNEPEHS